MAGDTAVSQVKHISVYLEVELVAELNRERQHHPALDVYRADAIGPIDGKGDKRQECERGGAGLPEVDLVRS